MVFGLNKYYPENLDCDFKKDIKDNLNSSTNLNKYQLSDLKRVRSEEILQKFLIFIKQVVYNNNTLEMPDLNDLSLLSDNQKGVLLSLLFIDDQDKFKLLYPILKKII